MAIDPGHPVADEPPTRGGGGFVRRLRGWVTDITDSTGSAGGDAGGRGGEGPGGPGDGPPDGTAWHAEGVTADGRAVPLEVVGHEERPTGRSMADALLAGGANPALEGSVRRHLTPSDEAVVVPGIDPISDWADAAAAATRGNAALEGQVVAVELGEGVRGVWFRSDRPDEPGCLAWHEDAFAVVDVPDGFDHVRVSATESARSRTVRESAEALFTGYAGPPPRTETWVEWFGFYGGNTQSETGSDALPDRPRGTVDADVDVDGRRGRLAARVWHWLGGPLDRPSSDPLWETRLAHDNEVYAEAADLVPDVRMAPTVADVDAHTSLAPGAARRMVVWVHGTVSTGLDAADTLRHDLTVPFYRYEHDTFRSISENASELAALLDARLRPGGRVELVGHSRGGLVARVAANRLHGGQPRRGIGARTDLRVQVLTLGTPHLGTPVVNAGSRVLRALTSVARFGVAPLPDPASMLLKYLLTYVRLPSGIRDMAVGSPFLEGLEDGPGEPYALRSAGGDYARGPEPESTGVRGLGRVRGLFEGAPNDLVVSVASATGRGTAHPLAESCGHFGYLYRDEVRREILAMMLRP